MLFFSLPIPAVVVITYVVVSYSIEKVCQTLAQNSSNRRCTTAMSVTHLAAEGHVIADKRPNPKQRKKKLKAISQARATATGSGAAAIASATTTAAPTGHVAKKKRY